MTRNGDVFPRNIGDDDRARLTALFAAASAPAEDGPQPGEAAVLAAFREIVAEPAGVVSLGARRMRRRAAVAATMTSLAVFSGGIAAAATGALPDAAQQVAKDMFGAVGVHVPGAPQHPAHPAHPAHPSTPASPSPTATDLPTAVEPTHPTHPAFPTTPPTPGNSGAARQHGVPAPATHPAKGHGKPTAKPSPAPQSHPATPTRRPTPTHTRAATTHRHLPTHQPAAVTQRFRPSISK